MNKHLRRYGKTDMMNRSGREVYHVGLTLTALQLRDLGSLILQPDVKTGGRLDFGWSVPSVSQILYAARASASRIDAIRQRLEAEFERAGRKAVSEGERR